nr:hypothetical protein [Klebsiella pneumoniae subsp. pneumoniae]
MFYGFVIGNTNDSPMAVVKDKLVVDFNQSMTNCAMAEKDRCLSRPKREIVNLMFFGVNNDRAFSPTAGDKCDARPACR